MSSKNKQKIDLKNSKTLKSCAGNIYVLEEILGKGTFGVVYLAHLFENKETDINKKFAIKRYFKTYNPNQVQIEISMISYLNKRKYEDKINILNIVDGNFDEETGELFFVSEYFEHDNFSEFYKNLNITQIQNYMYQLLKAISFINKNGIIHRDIKPDNFLYNVKTNKSLLVDFGLAEIDSDNDKWKLLNKNNIEDVDYKILSELQKNGNYRHKIGTRGFVPPEVIFKNTFQSGGVDVWAAGVILLIFLSKRLPVFNLNTFCKIKSEIIKELLPLLIVFGREEICKIAKECNCHIFIGSEFDQHFLGRGLDELIVYKPSEKDNPEKLKKEKELINEAKDLVKKLLEINFQKRIKTEDALKHDFFKDLREKEN